MKIMSVYLLQIMCLRYLQRTICWYHFPYFEVKQTVMSSKKITERPSYRSNTNGVFGTPKKIDAKCNHKYLLSESKLALYGLIVSLLIITAKLYYFNRKLLHDFFYERELISFEEITREGQVAFRNVWIDSLKYSKYWLPVLCGLISTYFTWLVVYLDSDVPGVQPPSPLSPSKYKLQSGHSFHLNYVFALLVGILVSIYMFWKEISL
ncbi:hemopoietic lineage transmembrane helix [Popillia japonica]|uniref:Hemopoietic lineage transmembrane helix n=1 Tax=Popillia japonica TaxID=7064 RepID=A0AAW1MY90_POPJA